MSTPPAQTPPPAPGPRAGRAAFVTGATGFLGRNLVERLVNQGWQVTALHRPGADTAPLRALDVCLAAGNILDLATLEAGIPADVDAVFHLAADTSVWSRNNAIQYRTNVDGTRNVLAAARRRGAGRVIATSSWSVWGYGGQHPPKAGPITEETPKLGDRSWINYERTKFYAEVAAAGAVWRGLDVVLLNPANILGRYDRRNWSRLVRLAMTGKLPAIPPGHGEFCHAGAVADAHIAAVDRGQPGHNYLLGGPSASFREIVQMIGKISGTRARAPRVPPWLFRRVAAIKGWWGDIRDREPDVTPEGAAMVLAGMRITSDKAARELGYVSPDLETMLSDCIAWLKEARLV